MKHFIILYFIISFTLGVLALAASAFIYIRYKIRDVKYYFFFLFMVTISFLLNTVNFYMGTFADIESQKVYITLFYLHIINQGAVLYCMPLFFFHLFGIPFTKVIKGLFLSLTVLSFVVIVIISSIHTTLLEKLNFAIKGYYLFSGLRVACIILILCIGVIRFRKIQLYETKLFIKAIGITTGLVLPIMVFGIYFPYFKLFWQGKLMSISNLSIYYCIWNLVSLVTLGWYLIYKIDKRQFTPKLESFAQIYGITEREKDVIEMVVQGHSNKEICKKLFISMSTVKTHLYNIFRKTKVKNRVELVNLIKK